MRAIRGVVTKVVNSILTIKLENGLVIELPHKTEEFGKSVLVEYDYTINKIKGLIDSSYIQKELFQEWDEYEQVEVILYPFEEIFWEEFTNWEFWFWSSLYSLLRVLLPVVGVGALVLFYFYTNKENYND